MDTTIVIIVLVFAVIAVAAFVVYRGRSETGIELPGGIKFSSKAVGQAEPQVVQRKSTSTEGGATARSYDGGSVLQDQLQVKKDLVAESRTAESPNDPKGHRV